ncbi:MAG: hypothetical protein WA871_02950, partial [Candidatus Acidiferrales bacterium]
RFKTAAKIAALPKPCSRIVLPYVAEAFRPPAFGFSVAPASSRQRFKTAAKIAALPKPCSRIVLPYVAEAFRPPAFACAVQVETYKFLHIRQKRIAAVRDAKGKTKPGTATNEQR